MHFFPNALAKGTNIPVFLGAVGPKTKPMFNEKEDVCDSSGENAYPIVRALGMRKNILCLYLSDFHIQVNHLYDLHKLKANRQNLSGAPLFDVKLSGELSEAMIFEALYVQGSYIGSMGLDVSYALDKVEDFHEGLEHQFRIALMQFWGEFERNLLRKELTTFNHVFWTLASEDATPTVKAACLAPFRHLLIDEFQDISPAIVRWITRFQRMVAAKELRGYPVSLMAIGDDWQSIYAWRGSSPEFFISFDAHFPSKGAASICKMNRNYRSASEIVDQSKKLIEGVKSKIDKKPYSEEVFETAGVGVHLRRCPDYGEESLGVVLKNILRELERLKDHIGENETAALVICRTNEIKRTFKKAAQTSGVDLTRASVKVLTIHKAKGLEAVLSVMIGNCEAGDFHQFRNRIYALSSISKSGYTYDLAMADEAQRLAYVGVTRGKIASYWYVDEPKGAAEVLNPWPSSSA